MCSTNPHPNLDRNKEEFLWNIITESETEFRDEEKDLFFAFMLIFTAASKYDLG